MFLLLWFKRWRKGKKELTLSYPNIENPKLKGKKKFLEISHFNSEHILLLVREQAYALEPTLNSKKELRKGVGSKSIWDTAAMIQHLESHTSALIKPA